MSLKKITSIVILGLAFIIGVAFVIHKTGNSFQNSDEVSFSGKKRKGYFASGKPNRTIDVSITDITEKSGQGLAKDDVKIAVNVSVNQKIDQDMKLQWILPSGVRLATGQESFYLHDLNPGQNYYFETILSGLNQAVPVTARLEVTAKIRGSEISTDGTFSSHITQPDLSMVSRFPASDDKPGAPKKPMAVQKSNAIENQKSKMGRIHF